MPEDTPDQPAPDFTKLINELHSLIDLDSIESENVRIENREALRFLTVTMDYNVSPLSVLQCRSLDELADTLGKFETDVEYKEQLVAWFDDVFIQMHELAKLRTDYKRWRDELVHCVNNAGSTVRAFLASQQPSEPPADEEKE